MDIPYSLSGEGLQLYRDRLAREQLRLRRRAGSSPRRRADRPCAQTICGRIGRSIYTTGALVTASQTGPLATIQRLDPIYVDIQQSSTALLKLRQQILTGRIARNGSVQRMGDHAAAADRSFWLAWG